MVSKLSPQKIQEEPMIPLDGKQKKSLEERQFDGLMGEINIQLGRLMGDVDDASGKKLEKEKIKKDIKNLNKEIVRLSQFLKNESIVFDTDDQVDRIKALQTAEELIKQKIISKKISTSQLSGEFSTLSGLLLNLETKTKLILNNTILKTITKFEHVKNNDLDENDQNLVNEANMTWVEMIEKERQKLIGSKKLYKKRDKAKTVNILTHYLDFSLLNHLLKYKSIFKDPNFKGFLAVIRTGQSNENELLALFKNEQKLVNISSCFQDYKNYVQSKNGNTENNEGKIRGYYKILRSKLNALITPNAIPSYRELQKS